MTTDEIKTNEIIAEAIDKLIEKYQKKDVFNDGKGKYV